MPRMREVGLNWDEVVESVGPRLHRYFSVRFDTAEASDLVQITLVRLVRKVEEGRFDARRGSLAAYAFGIAHLVQKEAIRTGRSRREVGDAALDVVPSAAASPEELTAQSNRVRRLRDAVAGLPEAERQVVTLLLDEELTLKDIGGILGMPVGTVKSHVHRAKEKLRQAMTNRARETV